MTVIRGNPVGQQGLWPGRHALHKTANVSAPTHGHTGAWDPNLAATWWDFLRTDALRVRQAGGLRRRPRPNRLSQPLSINNKAHAGSRGGW